MFKTCGLVNGFARRRAGLRRWLRPHWVAAAGGIIAVAAVAVPLACGGSGPTGPRALTPDEANRLAITRFRNYEASGRSLTIAVPGTAGGLVIRGSVDYRAKLGYGVVDGRGRDSSADGLIEWSASTVAFHPMADAPAEPPVSPPTMGWYSRPLHVAGSSLDSSLAIALDLGSDRPDNAQLLPQNGAVWIGRDQVKGHQVDVMAGPSIPGRPDTAGTVRYWIGAGGTMYRVQAKVASESQPVAIDFGTRKYVPVPQIPGIAPTR